MNVQNELRHLEMQADRLQKESDYQRMENLQLKKDLMAGSSSFSDNPQKTLVEYESDSRDILDQIFHFLLSHRIVFDKYGERWEPPRNKDEQIFSEAGATLIINQLLIYINKSQLSANLSEDQIEQKMYYLGIEFADFIYTNYEYLLEYQKTDRLFNRFRHDARFANYDVNQLYDFCALLSEEEMKQKYKYVDVMFVSVLDLIHANLTRAKGGEERSGRRKTTFTSQSIGGTMYEQPQRRGFMPK